VTADEQAIFDAAMRGLARRYRAHESDRAAAQSQAEADVSSRRMSCVVAAIEGVRELQAEIEAGSGGALNRPLTKQRTEELRDG